MNILWKERMINRESVKDVDVCVFWGGVASEFSGKVGFHE